MAELVPSSNVLAVNQLKAAVDRAPFVDALDVGVNWKDTGHVADYHSIVGVGSGICLMGGNGIVFRTTDYGEEFVQVGMPPSSYDATLSPITAMAYVGNGIVTAGGHGDLFRSLDYGLTWSISADPLNGAIARSMAYLGNGIALCGDSVGNIWRNVNYGQLGVWASSPLAGAAIGTITYLENGVVFCGTDDGHIFRSKDFGANWIDLGVKSGVGVPAIISSTNIGNGIAVFGTNNGHIYKSVDFGQTWILYTNLITPLVSTNILSMECIGNGIVIASDLNGRLFRTNDFATTWTDLGVLFTVGGIVGNLTPLKYLGDGVVLCVDVGLKVWKSDVAFKIDDAMPSIAVGISSGIGAGNTAGTSGFVYKQMMLVGGNNVTLSQSVSSGSATLTINASLAQSTQTSNIINEVSLSGVNTAGVLTDISSGTLYLAGGNNVTLSQNGNSITISGPNVLGAQTGISSIVASDATYTSGQVIFTGSNAVTVKSSAGQVVVIDVSTSQSAEPRVISLNGTSGSLSLSGASNITVSALNGSTITIYGPTNILNSFSVGGNTGTTGSSNISGGGFVLAGGSNITLSQSNNSISIHGLSSQSAEPRVISLNGTSGSLSISGVSNITVSALNGSTITIYGPANILNSLSVGGNTGTTGSSNITGGGFVLAGGSNITLSQSNATISIHGPTFSNSNNVSFGTNLGTVTASASFNQTDQPRVISLNGTSGSLSLSGASNITVSGLNGSTITIYGPSNILNSFSIGGNTGTTGSSAITGGGFVLAGGSNVTISQSNNSISVHAAAVGAGSFTAGASNLGNVVGDTGMVNNRLVFAGGANMTISQSIDGQSATMTFNLAAVGAGSFTAGMSNLGNTAGTTGVVQNQILFAGGNSISLSQSINGQSGTITINGVQFSNSNNFTFGANAGTITVSFSESIQTGSIINAVSLFGNTSGVMASISSGTMYLAGGNNLTLSQNANSITISGGDSFSAGVSNLGNTLGNTGLKSQRIVFVGGNNITLSQDTGAGIATVTINGMNFPITSISVASTLGLNDDTMLIDASSGPVTVTLPSAASVTGRTYTIKKIDSSTNIVTVGLNGADTVDGATTLTLIVQYEARTVKSYNNKWWIV